uniref:6-phosphogluconolactonase n=1 Tax=Echinostoma caproni TaxID=27848 RepID=A0A183AXS9_9TREM
LIDAGVRVIISLTGCGAAMYTAQVTSKHHVVHLVIPFPVCQQLPPEGEMLTLWFQPDPKAITQLLFQIASMEHASNTLLLNNGESVAPNELLSMSVKAMLDDANFFPAFSVQQFSTEADRLWDTEGRYAQPSLPALFSLMESTRPSNLSRATFEHVFAFTPNGGELEVVRNEQVCVSLVPGIDKLMLQSKLLRKKDVTFAEQQKICEKLDEVMQAPAHHQLDSADVVTGQFSHL